VFAKKPKAEGICCHWPLGILGTLFYDEVVLDSGSARSEPEFMRGEDYAMLILKMAAEKKYNEYLNSKPNLEGTIVIKFTVTHSGRVINDTILSSTTKNEKFDKDIRKLLRESRWKEIDSGTTTATVPFTFWKSVDDFRRDNPENRIPDSLSLINYLNREFPHLHIEVVD
jgi:TonB family protein